MAFQAHWVSGPEENFQCFKRCLGVFVPPVASHLSFCFIGVSANRLMDGAMQLTFRKMAFDYYPFHWAGMGVLNGAVPAWPRY